MVEFVGHLHGLRDPFTALVTLVDLVVYMGTLVAVGRARVRFGVKAPDSEGPPEFSRVMRVQTNTVEQIILQVPLLWLAAASVSDASAALVGIMWPVGRVLYARGYYKAAEKREFGFLISCLSTVIMFVACVFGVSLSLIR